MIGRGKAVALIAAAGLGVTPVPALAGASDFILVNRTGSAIGSLSIRRFPRGPWYSLAVSQGPAGKAAVTFRHEECAFDIRATLGGKDTLTWSGVNLCEAKAVILKRHDSGVAWVDYE